jgi:hypothetical protein
MSLPSGLICGCGPTIGGVPRSVNLHSPKVIGSTIQKRKSPQAPRRAARNDAPRLDTTRPGEAHHARMGLYQKLSGIPLAWACPAYFQFANIGLGSGISWCAGDKIAQDLHLYVRPPDNGVPLAGPIRTRGITPRRSLANAPGVCSQSLQ